MCKGNYCNNIKFSLPHDALSSRSRRSSPDDDAAAAAVGEAALLAFLPSSTEKPPIWRSISLVRASFLSDASNMMIMPWPLPPPLPPASLCEWVNSRMDEL